MRPRQTPARRRPTVAPPTQLSLAEVAAGYEVNRLPAEVARYLETVETFRKLGAVPRWRRESDGR